MANADQVKALVRSHADGDDTRFYSVALQVAARAARSGQGHFAQELRDLVDALRKDAQRRDRPSRLRFPSPNQGVSSPTSCRSPIRRPAWPISSWTARARAARSGHA